MTLQGENVPQPTIQPVGLARLGLFVGATVGKVGRSVRGNVGEVGDEVRSVRGEGGGVGGVVDTPTVTKKEIFWVTVFPLFRTPTKVMSKKAVPSATNKKTD